MKKTLIPNDFRDTLSIISIAGMLAIFLKFSFNLLWLDENLTNLFLVIIGFGLVISGQLFTIKRWIRDGLQGGEVVKVLTNVMGLTAIIIGLLMMLNVMIPKTFFGIVGIIGLFSAIVIFIDYIKKNKK